MDRLNFDYSGKYLELHDKKPKWFSGKISKANAKQIAALVEQVKAKRLLDWGSGKGYQYLRDRIHELWGGILPHCYDCGVRQLINKPEGKFDGVICTDVMEHIAERDVKLILDDIFGCVAVPGFVYFNIYCGPSRKHFTDGTPVHQTVKSPDWWDARLNRYARDGLIIKATYVDTGDHH